jgi:UDP-3-O-[3-hydroxymyristoyl] glucosamine N-acyltransferase
MQFSAAQIAMIINASVEGDSGVVVDSFGKIEEAKKGQLAFLANPKYEDFLYTTEASIIIVNEALKLKQPVNATLLRVPDAYSSFAQLLGAYQELVAKQLKGIQQPSVISASATLGENVFVGAFSYVGDNVKIGDNVKVHAQVYIGNDVKIGKGTVLHPGVKIYQGCRIGENVTIHAGTVIGSDGFGFAPQTDGTYKKVPQIGNVIVEDNVEIGSYTVFAAQSGVSGSTKIGKNVMIGGQVGIVGHITIADGSRINAQSGVTKSINAPMAVTGSPAFNYAAALRSQAVSRNLPELEKRIKELEKQIQMMLEKSML